MTRDLSEVTVLTLEERLHGRNASLQPANLSQAGINDGESRIHSTMYCNATCGDKRASHHGQRLQRGSQHAPGSQQARVEGRQVS